MRRPRAIRERKREAAQRLLGLARVPARSAPQLKAELRMLRERGR